MILRCTRKLLTVLGSAVAEPAPAPDPGDWYANLLRFDRRTCLLLTRSATLFTIFEADVTASSLRATRQLVTGLIGRELRREELPAGTFGDLGQQQVLLAKMADRSVLGCMNDMAFRCEHAIADAGGLARTGGLQEPQPEPPLGGLLEPRQGKRRDLLIDNVIPGVFVRGAGRAAPGSGGGDDLGDAVSERPGLGDERAAARGRLAGIVRRRLDVDELARCNAGTSPRSKYDLQYRLTLIASKGRSLISRNAPWMYRMSGNPVARTSASARMC